MESGKSAEISETPISADDMRLSSSSLEKSRKTADIPKQRDKAISSHGGKHISARGVHDDAPYAPDGGWGWVVVLGAFVNGLVAAGFTSLISVLYVEWTSYFDVGPGEMSWIGFLFPGTAGFVSIIIGNLWALIGVRRTAIIGALLSVIGCLAGSFSTQPTHIALSIGVVSGIGVGLCYISSINMVAVYFHKRFGLANGIMFLGTSISQVGVPPLTRLLVSLYGWRGTLQVIGALMGNSIAAACLFRPLAVANRPPTSEGKKRRSNSATKSPALPLRGHGNRGSDSDGDVLEMEILYELSTPIGTPVIHRRCRSDLKDNEVTRTTTMMGRDRQTDYLQNDGMDRTCEEDVSPRRDVNRRSQICNPIESGNTGGADETATVSETVGKNRRGVTKPCTSDLEHSRKANHDHAGGLCIRVLKVLADMIGLTLFYNEPVAILQNASSIVVMIGTFVPVAHVMAMAIDRGMEHGRAAALLSILGVGGTAGRLLAGVLVDKHIIGPHRFMMAVNVVVGIPIGLLPLVIDVFVHTAVTIFIAGIGIGSTIVLRVIQARKVVAPHFISDAVRIVVMTTGVGMTIGAVLSGLVADATGSYSASFYVAADILLVGAVINLMLSVVARCRRGRHRDVAIEEQGQISI